MGITKAEQFTKQQNELAKLAKAIGHPARIAILEHLYKTNDCICGEIVDEIGLAQATISQHLKALKEAELIKGTTEGRNVCYCINSEKLKDLGNILSRLSESGTCEKNYC